MIPPLPYHALSLGAGVNSTALLHLIVDEGLPLDDVVFADTSAEKPETYAYLKEQIIPFLQANGIPYHRVAAKETLIERCMRGHTIPDMRYRWSTRDYKIRPIEKHLKPHAPVVVYLGIAYDEAHRMKPSRKDWVTHAWPLVDRGIDRVGCEEIIKAKGWPVPAKSGCYFCPFSRLSEWRGLYHDHPNLWVQAIEIEENCSKFPNFSLVPGGLRRLGGRFRGEDSQKVLEAFEDECGGYCFT